jgi:hypothetical protein
VQTLEEVSLGNAVQVSPLPHVAFAQLVHTPPAPLPEQHVRQVAWVPAALKTHWLQLAQLRAAVQSSPAAPRKTQLPFVQL